MARSTKQRSAIMDLLGQVSDFRSAQELHATLREQGSRIGLTTVYRTLQALADAGSVDVMRLDGGEVFYRLCSDGHHHHLVCRVCGKTVEVEGAVVETWADKVAAEYGFTNVNHTFELFGRCADCSSSEQLVIPRAGCGCVWPDVGVDRVEVLRSASLERRW
ncbi:transcriptional repressor [Natronoglycomyces albus]|uniref:Transcriptional repressor n=1 Tax=Natronoglycomyces albus TaxID=2811108 RepID=A0A895XUL5_9ACTN|nr:transcriptional repressor [Natronoglycomyces albus]